MSPHYILLYSILKDTIIIYIWYYFYWKIGKDGKSEVSWGFVWVIILGLAAAGAAGYAFYKYRVRVSNHSTSTIFRFGSFIINFFCRHTWILRSGPLWHSICRWTTRGKSKFTDLMEIMCKRIQNSEKGFTTNLYFVKGLFVSFDILTCFGCVYILSFLLQHMKLLLCLIRWKIFTIQVVSLY